MQLVEQILRTEAAKQQVGRGSLPAHAMAARNVSTTSSSETVDGASGNRLPWIMARNISRTYTASRVGMPRARLWPAPASRTKRCLTGGPSPAVVPGRAHGG